MDLRQQALIVAGIREKMQQSLGAEVYIKVNLGRSRINENVAVITATHPSVFIATLQYKRGRKAEQSFQYADILTGVVEVLMDGKPMFGPFDIQPDAPLVENKPKLKKRLRPVKPFEQRIRLNAAQVAMLAERLKKEQGSNKDSASKDLLISELSHKYDLMKKVEKTKMAGRVPVSFDGESGAKEELLNDKKFDKSTKESKTEKSKKKSDKNSKQKAAPKKSSAKKSDSAKKATKSGGKTVSSKKVLDEKKKAETKKATKAAVKASVDKKTAKAKAAKNKKAASKTVAKKPVTKKATAKTISAKKTTAKKPAAKKSVAKKSNK